jgi:hypothetical protein
MMEVVKVKALLSWPLAVEVQARATRATAVVEKRMMILRVIKLV